MRRIAAIIGGSLLVTALWTGSLYPLGIGAYGFVRKGRDAAHLSTFSYGLLLDTALAENKLFNFRYQVGHQRSRRHKAGAMRVHKCE